MAWTQDSDVTDALGRFLSLASLGAGASYDSILLNAVASRIGKNSDAEIDKLVELYGKFLKSLERYQPDKTLAEERFGAEVVRGRIFYIDPIDGNGHWIDSIERILEKIRDIREKNEGQERETMVELMQQGKIPACTIS